MFRVYDRERKAFVNDIYLGINDKPYRFIKKFKLFGQLVEAQEIDEDETERYLIQYPINFMDKDGTPIFEGDICKLHDAEQETYLIIGWSVEAGCNCGFDYNWYRYYPIDPDIVLDLEVIGNVCTSEYPFINEDKVEDKTEDDNDTEEVPGDVGEDS